MDAIELQQGRTRVTVIPGAGGRIHQIEVRRRGVWLPLLLAPNDFSVVDRQPLEWGCYPMAPWPGRIDGGRFLFEGRQYAVPVTGGERHALHGLGVRSAWQVKARSSEHCRMSLDFGDAWPFGGRAVHEVAVEDDAVALRLEVHATKPGRMPVGAGWHPWFRRDAVAGTQPRVSVDAIHVYETADMIPTGWLMRVTGDRDLRVDAPLGDRRIDVCYRSPQQTSISWGSLELTMESSANVGHAVVYTPERGICVEPQTCAPDAFNLAAQGIAGCGMTVVTPSRPLIATTTWRWRYAR
jgi:aldose 1-epimerase